MMCSSLYFLLQSVSLIVEERQNIPKESSLISRRETADNTMANNNKNETPNNNSQNTTHKIKTEQHEPSKQPW